MSPLSRTIAAIVAMGGAAVAQVQPPDLFDPPPTAGMTDLAKTPLWVELLSKAGLTLGEESLKARFTKEFTGLQTAVERELAGSRQGYLLKVEVYVDGNATPLIPEGQLVSPVGRGNEPLDALAEDLRKRVVRRPHPANATNASYYIWLKVRDGKLTGGMIPREFRQGLEQRAKEEAERRELLGAWTAALPEGGIPEVKRSVYWNQVAAQYAKLLANEASQAKAKRLTEAFETAEREFNKSYRKFRETQEEMNRAERYNSSIANAQGIIGLIGSAVQTGALVCSQKPEVPPRTDAEPPVPLREIFEYTRTKIDGWTGNVEQQKVRIEQQGRDLQRRNDELSQVFREGNTSIPDADLGPILPKP